jgi:hypothetical protein
MAESSKAGCGSKMGSFADDDDSLHGQNYMYETTRSTESFC